MSVQVSDAVKAPKVTVLMAVYNGERYLREAIESILNQTFIDFEFLIINDGSADSSRDIILSYVDPRIRIIDNSENMGLTKSLNRGLSLARGEYLARQDADDISYSTRLEKQVAFLEMHREVALLGTQLRYINQKGENFNCFYEYRACGVLAIRWQLMFDNPFAHSAVMIRTEIMREFGGYNERFQVSQDFDLWSRLVVSHSACNLREVLVCFRSHPDSICSKYSKNHVLAIINVFNETFRNCMKEDPPKEWVENWLSITNPYLFDSSYKVTYVIESIEAIYKKFVVLYPFAQNDAEIQKHITYVFLRISFNLTLKSRFSSLYAFFRALNRDIVLSLGCVPVYVVALFFGRHRKYVSVLLAKLHLGLWRICGRI